MWSKLYLLPYSVILADRINSSLAGVDFKRHIIYLFLLFIIIICIIFFHLNAILLVK